MLEKISVVIPVYNIPERYLRPCLDSLLGQTVGNWEAVCVDDGSTNESGAVLDEYAEKDPRIVVVHTPNGGVGGARNVALERIRGDWVVFLDADDVLHRQALEFILSAIRHEPRLDYVYYDYLEIASAEERDNFRQAPLGPPVCHWLGDNLSSLRDSLTVWRIAFRRELLATIRFSDLKAGEDLLFAQQVLVRAKGVVYLPVRLYGYFLRSDSTVHTRNPQKTFSSIEFNRRFCHFYDDYRDVFSRRLLNLRVLKVLCEIPAWGIKGFEGPIRQKLIDAWAAALADIRSVHASRNLKFVLCVYSLAARPKLSRGLTFQLAVFLFGLIRFGLSMRNKFWNIRR